MSFLVKVAVPEMAVEPLTYSTDVDIHVGARVIVNIQGHLHAGFMLGEADEAPGSDIKPLDGVIDDEPVIDADIWDVITWGSKVCMCGINRALRAVLPKNFYMGDRIEAPPHVENSGKFREVHNFNPFDSERVNFYAGELEGAERTLVLFSTRDEASGFYAHLPRDLKHEAVLWPFLDVWEAWPDVNAKKYRIVIGAPGAVFAPLSPQKIIVDDEASSAYLIPYGLRLSARSIAGRRAQFLGSTLILGGRIPSLKTYMRARPKMESKPDRKDIVLADIYRSRREESSGTDGSIPLTYSLIRRTYTELLRGHNVMWFLNRPGSSQEVYCEKCGHVVKCQKCGHTMRVLSGGEMLKCPKCKALRAMPVKCEECGAEFFRGKRPGIEALAHNVSRYYPKVRLYVKGTEKNSMKGLILTTNKGLELLPEVRPSLTAWLDLDAELWGDDYDLRYNLFVKLYKCLYAGRKPDVKRTLLIQARSSGMKFAGMIADGWSRFLTHELREREEFMLPPYAYSVEIDDGGRMSRDFLIDALEEVGLFVMDPGDESKPLYVQTESLDEISGILEPYSRALTITVRSE